MPTYHVGCNDCFEDFEELRSIKLGPRESCIFCNSTNVEQIYYAPSILTKSEPKTLGHLADKNRDNMSQGEFQEKMGEHKAHSDVARKQVKTPWWRSTDKVDPRIASMSKEDTDHYIKTGSKPFKDD